MEIQMHYLKGSGEEQLLLGLSLPWRNEHLELQMTYVAGLLFAYVAFIPFCEAEVTDNLSLRRLLENTFQLDVQAMREYCLADDRLLEAVKFLDLGNGAGRELLQAMLNPDFRQRPITEAQP